jgi:hypothetical protein
MFNLELGGHNRKKQSKEEINKTIPHNTDNMGKLFVTFFAFCTCSQDWIVPADKPGSLHCL